MKYIKWYIQAARPYWKQMSIMLLCNLLIAGCAVGYVFVSKELVDVAVALFKSGGSGRELGVWAAAMIAIVLVRILLNAVRSFVQTTTEVKFKNALRRRLFDSLMHLRNESAVRLHSGDLLNRMLEGTCGNLNVCTICNEQIILTAHYLNGIVHRHGFAF